MLLPIARAEGLARVMVTCDDDNEASRRVIVSSGGKLAGCGPSPLVNGKTLLTFWIDTKD
jgi:predicted acetyltransferase